MNDFYSLSIYYCSGIKCFQYFENLEQCISFLEIASQDSLADDQIIFVDIEYFKKEGFYVHGY